MLGQKGYLSLTIHRHGCKQAITIGKAPIANADAILLFALNPDACHAQPRAQSWLIRLATASC